MNNKRNNSNNSLGLYLGDVLGVVFIVLKLVGVINWSWVWVLSPFWIRSALTFVIAIGLYCYYKHDEKKYKNRWNQSSKK